MTSKSKVYVTEHFTLGEFAQPKRHGFPWEPYPEAWINRLLPLCTMLEEVRETWKKPIKILSGYRSEEYNRAIGGSRFSQHVLGRAVDFKLDVDPLMVHDVILHMIKNGQLKQVKGLGKYPTFTHIDIRHQDRLSRWSGLRTTL